MKILLESYATIDSVNTLSVGLMALVTVLLGLRCTRDIMGAMEDPETGLMEAMKKVKKRVFATIVALLTTSFVAYFQSFYTG